MHVYCNFYCSPAKKIGSDPLTFLGWGRHCLCPTVCRKDCSNFKDVTLEGIIGKAEQNKE